MSEKEFTKRDCVYLTGYIDPEEDVGISGCKKGKIQSSTGCPDNCRSYRRKALKKETKREPNECPRCGKELSEDFDAVDIDIDLQTGFVCLKRKCDCGAKLQLFFDYDRTEEE